VEVAIGIEPQLRWAMEPVGQFLAGIAERLEVADGVWMLQHVLRGLGPITPFWRLTPRLWKRVVRDAAQAWTV